MQTMGSVMRLKPVSIVMLSAAIFSSVGEAWSSSRDNKQTTTLVVTKHGSHGGQFEQRWRGIHPLNDSQDHATLSQLFTQSNEMSLIEETRLESSVRPAIYEQLTHLGKLTDLHADEKTMLAVRIVSHTNAIETVANSDHNPLNQLEQRYLNNLRRKSTEVFGKMDEERISQFFLNQIRLPLEQSLSNKEFATLLDAVDLDFGSSGEQIIRQIQSTLMTNIDVALNQFESEPAHTTYEALYNALGNAVGAIRINNIVGTQLDIRDQFQTHLENSVTLSRASTAAQKAMLDPDSKIDSIPRREPSLPYATRNISEIRSIYDRQKPK